MATLEIQVPDIGDFDEVTVIELMVKPGDTVAADQSLITVESDKASMEIPSSHGGVVKAVLVKVGDKVKQGSLVVTLEAAGTTPAAAVTQAVQATVTESKPTPASVAPTVAVVNTVGPTGSGSVEVRVPDIGDFKDVSVIEMLVKVGDTVKAEQSLMTVESDKAAMEIPSSAGGIVKELRVKLADKVNIGDVIAVLEGVAGSSAPVQVPVAVVNAPVSTPPAAAAVQSAAGVATALVPAVLPPHQPTTLALGLPHASPSVRKFARELGVPLEEVKGSGQKGRIT